MCQAYRFALDPTPRQEQMLRSHAGARRFAWNLGLAWCRQRYATEQKWYSAADMHRMWNVAKRADPGLAWWAENSKCVYQEAFRDLDRALCDYSKSKRGERKGKRLGFPRPKKRGKCKDAFRFSTGVMRCAGATVTLPRLGTIRTHESTRKLARRLEPGTARVLSATVSRTAERWFVSFQVEVRREVPGRHPRPGSAVGVDLGVRTLLTGVDDAGQVIPVTGPKALASSLRGWPGCTPGWRTSGPMPCTRPPAAWPASMRPWSSRTSTSLACWPTGGWPAPWPTRASAPPGGCSATRPPGTADGCLSQTGGIPPARRARGADGESQA